MPKTIPKENIAGYECRFAVYCPPPYNESDDFHLVKEIIHTNDGKTVPNVRMIRNHPRPFWVTKKGFQNHKDKKEWEELDKLQRYDVPQSKLFRAAERALGMHGRARDLRMLSRSPYLYGTDLLSTSSVKQMYQSRFPNLLTPYSVAAFDIETDVIEGTEEIIMATLSYRDRVVTAIKKSFVAGLVDVMPRLNEALTKYLGEIVEKRGIKWEVVFVENETDTIIECFNRAHEWKPDFVAIWNINFDMPKMLKALKKACIDPKDVFSDPKVPKAYRHFTYKVGKNKKVTASGKVTPIKAPAQWHTVFCPSSFYFIDSMCAYKHIRTGNAEEPSYALDSILKKHKLGGKLKFEEADGMSGIDWHQFMQSRFKLEYVIYNVYDCVSMELLDEITTDLSIVLPMFSGISDFENFKSQPRRSADSIHFYCLEHNRAIGSTCDEMSNDLDKETLGLEGWIVTLPAHLVMDNGLQVIAENPQLRTNIRGHVADLDVAGSYPNGECVFNVSKETTHKELCRIEGVPELTQRMQGINLSGGHVNAVEFCTEMYKLPTMETLLAAFNETRTV